ncbi:MAG: LuxR C-terminal-related transcriptional regulator [Parabacteroides sp.]|nr:LuxR C-terminal-related transcriptional regulator [Parabacteroides sp.]
MHRNKQIAIILSDTLRSIGLQGLLTDYFSPVEVCYFPTFEMLSSTGSDTYDYYFTDSDTLVLNADFFLPRRNKTAILIDSTEEHGALSSTNRVTIRSSQETIIEQLQQLFTSDNSGNAFTENNKDLSSREIDVLQLIVKGITNKEIADKLSISLNTVLTHRKNITAKLGIKTVSGLTFYAIMNGIISGDDIEL